MLPVLTRLGAGVCGCLGMGGCEAGGEAGQVEGGRFSLRFQSIIECHLLVHFVTYSDLPCTKTLCVCLGMGIRVPKRVKRVPFQLPVSQCL